MAFANETKVGLLVVVALAGLGWLSVKSGAFGTALGTSMRELSTGFSDVEGLSVGSPVKVAGVPVGEVTAIQLQPNGNAILKFEVKNDVPLPADVSAQIATSGLIGERYLALVPGNSTLTGQTTLLPSSTKQIPSGSSAKAEDIAGNFAKVSDDLEAMTGTLRKVLGDPDNAVKIQQIIDGLSSFSGNLQNDSGDIIGNLKEASASLKELLGGAEGADTKNMINNFSRVAQNMARITDRLERGEGPIGQLLMGDTTSGTGAGFMTDMQSAMKDLKETMAKINSGQGTLGKLVNDPETAEKLDNALDTFSEVSDRMEQFRTEVAMEGYSLTNESGVGKGEFSLTLAPRPTRFYYLGLTADGFASKADDLDSRTTGYYGKEFGNNAKFTAQFGHVYQNALFGNDVAVRLGLKDSTGGVGVDTSLPVAALNRDLRLSADVYDFGGENTPNSNTAHVDVKARMDIIGNNLYGVAGYDNVLNQEYGSPFVGVGMRFQDDDLKYILGKAL